MRTRRDRDRDRDVAASAAEDELDDIASGYADTGPSITEVQRQLDVAIKEEDFETAARLRDRLKLLKVRRESTRRWNGNGKKGVFC